MARNEIEARRRLGGEFHGPTGEETMNERRRHESATGRAGGTGRFVAADAAPAPKKRVSSRGLAAERDGKLPGLERRPTPRTKEPAPGKKK